MILDPNGQPVSTKPRPTIQQRADGIAELVTRKIGDLLVECLKDVNGGIMPTKKKMKRFLIRERRPDGDLFYWRGQEILWVGNHQLQRNGERIRVILPHKKLFIKTPDEPVKATN